MAVLLAVGRAARTLGGRGSDGRIAGFGLRGSHIPPESNFDRIFYVWQHDNLVMSSRGDRGAR